MDVNIIITCDPIYQQKKSRYLITHTDKSKIFTDDFNIEKHNCTFLNYIWHRPYFSIIDNNNSYACIYNYLTLHLFKILETGKIIHMCYDISRTSKPDSSGNINIVKNSVSFIDNKIFYKLKWMDTKKRCQVKDTGNFIELDELFKSD